MRYAYGYSCHLLQCIHLMPETDTTLDRKHRSTSLMGHIMLTEYQGGSSHHSGHSGHAYQLTLCLWCWWYCCLLRTGESRRRVCPGSGHQWAGVACPGWHRADTRGQTTCSAGWACRQPAAQHPCGEDTLWARSKSRHKTRRNNIHNTVIHGF